MHPKRNIRRLAALTSLILMAGCGLATSDEERLARAGTSIETGEYRAAMIELKNVLANDPDNARARLMLASVSLGLGDVAAAEKELARATELAADEADVLPLHAEILLAKGDFAGVLALLGMEPGGLTADQVWAYRGEALLGTGSVEAAEANYREWLKAVPSSVAAEVGIITALISSGRSSEAVELLNELLRRAPTDSSAWRALARAKILAGDFSGGEEALNKAVELVPRQAEFRRYAETLASLVETQLVIQKTDDARRNLERLAGLAPGAPATLLLQARLARSDNDYAGAARHLQALLNIIPDNSNAQILLSNMQMMLGNYAQAATLLQRVVARSPDNMQARKLLAQVQLRQSEPSGALEVLAPMIDAETADADLYTILAQASLQQGDPVTAVTQLRAAVELDPDNPETKLNLASAYLQADDVENALEVIALVPEGATAAYRRERLLIAALEARGDLAAADTVAAQLLDTAGNQSTAVSVVADYYLRTGRNEEARTLLREFVAAMPGDAGARNLLARLELAAGEAQRAAQLFKSVLELDESNLYALLGLSEIAGRAGEAEEMERLLVQAARAHEDALPPRAILARSYLDKGDLSSAEVYADQLLAIGFNNPNVGEVVAKTLQAVGRNDEALAQFEQAARLDPNSARIQLGLARTYLTLDRSVDARQALVRALEIEPGWPPAMSQLVLVQMSQGDLAGAQATMSRFRDLYPGNATGMVLEGELLVYRRDFAGAASAFQRAVANGGGRSALLREYQARVDGAIGDPQRPLETWLEANPEDSLVRNALAQYYQVNGRSDEAVRQYERILQTSPDDSVVLNNLAWELQQRGDLQQALAMAEKAYAINRSSGSIADTLGWIYFELGQLDKSLELLGAAVRLTPGNAEIQFHYAAALVKSGDKARGRQILEQLTNSSVRFRSRERAEELLGQL